MKRMTLVIVAALAAALAVFAIAGCSSQSASSASTSGSTSASAASEQSQEEIIAELKGAIANAPAYKSVTITVGESSTVTDKAEAAEDDSSESAASSEAASSESAAADDADTEYEAIEAKTVYKFDASGETLKTSMVAEIEGITLQYFTDGDAAVFVSDGPVYSGTTEQFDLAHTNGVETFLVEEIGDLNTLVDCAAEAEKMESNGMTFYLLTLDPEKYIASDEILQIMADAGSPVKEASLTIGFEEDGSIASIDLATTYDDVKVWKGLMFSDYDNTAIDPMPEADKTYEEMEADTQAKLDALAAELEEAESAEASSEAAEAK